MKQILKIIKRIGILAAVVGISTLISYAVTSQLEFTTELSQTDSVEALEEETTDRHLTDGDTFMVLEERQMVGENDVHLNIYRPISENGTKDEIYCVEPGTALNVPGYTKEDIYSYTGLYTGRCGHANTSAAKFTYRGSFRYKFSNAYYYCTNDHVTQDSIIRNIYGEEVNTYDIGYIISLYPVAYAGPGIVELEIDNWADFKQYAVWRSNLTLQELTASRIERIKAKDASVVSQGEGLLHQAEVYQEMTEGIKATEYTDPYSGNTYEKEADSVIVPHTEEELEELKDNIKVDTDLETNLYKVGPFTLDYVYGWDSTLLNNLDNEKTSAISQFAMSGISDMYLAYEDENGNEQRIDISMFYRPNIGELLPIQGGANKRTGLTTGGKFATPKFWNYYSPKGQMNLNRVDWWSYDIYRNYPAPSEEFYVEFDFDGTLPASLKLKVEYSYLSIDFLACRRQGISYRLYESSHLDPSHRHCDDDGCWSCFNCYITLSVTEDYKQSLTYVDYYRKVIKEEYEIPFKTTGSTSMKVGGYVFEDYPQGKEQLADGVLDTSTDLMLQNVEVALYVADENGEIAKDKNGNEMLAELYTLEEEHPDLTEAELEEIRSADDYKRRINPTLTDAYGYYEFRGVKQGQKYIVKFTYNGQTYMPTEYLTKLNDYGYESVAQMVEDGAYDSPDNEEYLRERWRETSKGLEKASEREEFTERFAEIGSSPRNYESTNSLETGALERDGRGYYNETYSEYELLGFVLNKDGSYSEEGTRLIDSYLIIEGGKIVDTSETINDDQIATSNTDVQIQEGLITTKVKEYIEANHEYPTDFKTQIYQDIVDEIGGDEDETWKMLQFIEDCKMYSYTLNNINDDSSYDLYPVYNQYTTYVADGNKYPDNSYTYDKNEKDDNLYEGTMDRDESTYENSTLSENGTGIFSYVKWVDRKLTPTTASDPDAILWAGEAYTDSSAYYGISTRNSTKGSITYKNVYPGQLYINQGLWRRQEVDLALEKDIYKAAIKINGKTEVYDYDSYGHGVITPSEISSLKKEYTVNGVFNEAGFKEALNNLFNQTARDRWDIHLRMADYESYYATKHSRALYRSDYEYVTQNGRTGAALDVYVTYKISVRNQSQSILGRIMEVVDYYDDSYEYQDRLSWVTYEDGNKNNEIDSEEYYDMMNNIENGSSADGSIANARYVNSSDSTRYDRSTESDITERTITDGNTGVRAEYDAVYVRGLEDKKLASGETAYIYLTFKVKTDSSGHVIVNESDEDTSEDKMNFAEINGYITYYKDDTVLPNYGTVGSNDEAGLIDKDSKPGNLEADDLEEERYESNFEDDTDRAKSLHIYVDNESVRVLNGIVWEDQRNTVVDGATVGDGIRQNDENTVNNIKVELYEIEVDSYGNPIKQADGSYKLKDTGIVQIYENGNWTPATEQTAGEGNYEFTGFIPGDYIVRFNYGGGNNATYNGQDFKSTTYQVGIDQSGKTDQYIDTNKEGRYDGYRDIENQNETGTYGYDIAKADQDENNYSDAKDIWSRREQINNYSNNNGNGVTNKLAQTLSEHTTANANTEMKAETGVIVAEVEYNRQNSNSSTNANGEGNSNDTSYNSNSSDAYLYGNDINTEYLLQNVDFGLVERPKAQLELNKKVTNVRVTLANGQIIVDSTTDGPYLSWVSGRAYDIVSKRNEKYGQIIGGDTYDIYEADYEETDGNKGERYKDDEGGHGTEYYEYRKELITDKFTAHASGNGYNGLIQINMDEELMHGATIRIEYTLTVTNAGEIDYDGKGFYYRADGGNNNNRGNIVTTRADQVIDYVNNNLQFRETDNTGIWSIISTEDVINGQNGEDSNLVNSKVKNAIQKTVDGRTVNIYNSIVQTTSLNKDLIPVGTEGATDDQTSTSTKLVLSQLITAQNDTDDLTYDNIAEIVKTTNSVGRRMAYSVVGNQDPTQIPSEVDAAKAERVMILPPFGSATYIYIIIAIAATAILVVGIILIKKKVIGKKE